MPITFTIKQVPESLARRIRLRAQGNRRSLQQELLLMLERAASEPAGLASHAGVGEPTPPPWKPGPTPVAAVAPAASVSPPGGPSPRLTLEQIWERARRLGPASPRNESTAIIRRDRDERHSR